jgi:hypothetical protein
MTTEQPIFDPEAAADSEVASASAIASAVKKALGGEVVSLVGCNGVPYRIQKVVTFGLGQVDGVPCMRYVGEGCDPNGTGSHSVIPSWRPHRLDPLQLVAVLAMQWGDVNVVFLAKRPMPPYPNF